MLKAILTRLCDFMSYLQHPLRLCAGSFFVLVEGVGVDVQHGVGLAVAKWIGTLAPTILFGWISYNPYVLVFGIFCSVFDLIYIGLILNHPRKGNVL